MFSYSNDCRTSDEQTANIVGCSAIPLEFAQNIIQDEKADTVFLQHAHVSLERLMTMEGHLITCYVFSASMVGPLRPRTSRALKSSLKDYESR